MATTWYYLYLVEHTIYPSYSILSATNNTVHLETNYLKHVTFPSEAEMVTMYAPIIMPRETSWYLPVIGGGDNR